MSTGGASAVHAAAPAVLLFLALGLAGCVGGAGETDVAPEDGIDGLDDVPTSPSGASRPRSPAEVPRRLEAPYPEIEWRFAERSWEKLTPTATTDWGPSGLAAEVELNGTVLEAFATLHWDLHAHRFGLAVQGPAGGTEQATSSLVLDRNVFMDIEDVTGGTYRFEVTQWGPAAVDQVDLFVDWLAAPEDWIEYEEVAGGWRARALYRDGGIEAANMRAALSTTHGEIAVIAGAEDAYVEVVAWADGADQAEAAARVKEINPTYIVGDEVIQGKADVPGDDWTDRGADIRVYVPDDVNLTVAASFSNGSLVLDHVLVGSAHITAAGEQGNEVRFRGVRAGPVDVAGERTEVTGDLSVAGNLTIGVTHGRVDLDVTPTDNLTLVVNGTDASRGHDPGAGDGPPGPPYTDILLGLAEPPEVGYDLEVDPGGGNVTEELAGAELSGEGPDRRLVTLDGEERPVQVTGSVTTEKGRIAFRTFPAEGDSEDG